ncbi:DNA ligase D [Rossellomorea marisflavi]|uniref:DNA ligase D n=1 Tax=Rossellomorea marisflavi TaxID=189381 RepID=UPI003AE5BE20
MKPMLPTLTTDPPEGDIWLSEVKYDGFRGILQIETRERMKLISRNGTNLLPQFPEIEKYINELIEEGKLPVPLMLDGEIVLLRTSLSSEFRALQVRGRMKNQRNIQRARSIRPAVFLCFDLLRSGSKETKHLPYEKRKEILLALFCRAGLPTSPSPHHRELLQMIPCTRDHHLLFKEVYDQEGEGLVFKKKYGTWEEGVRSTNWLKVKNWKTCSCFITGWESRNDYFHVGVYRGDEIISLGAFHFGLSPGEKRSLKQIIQENHTGKDGTFFSISPSITVELHYLERYDDGLREPHFSRFLFSEAPETCSEERFRVDELSLPGSVSVTHPDKPIFEGISKLEYLHYLRKVSGAILPFIHGRALTCIRYPHGIFGESFYQKNTPEHAPDFVETVREHSIDYTLCHTIDTLMWLGNQLALELHVPFQLQGREDVFEVAFDLDPPDRSAFPLAVKAALILKDILDRLHLRSFVKTSGNKGLQLHIPIPRGYTWDDTRLFTEFIARYLVSTHPEEFTVERLKKERKGRLYIDYVQHGPGKTLVAPYSVRGNNEGLVSTPLLWEEVDLDLDPSRFTMEAVVNRFREIGCPFFDYYKAGEQQPFKEVMTFLQSNG